MAKGTSIRSFFKPGQAKPTGKHPSTKVDTHQNSGKFKPFPSNPGGVAGFVQLEQQPEETTTEQQ